MFVLLSELSEEELVSIIFAETVLSIRFTDPFAAPEPVLWLCWLLTITCNPKPATMLSPPFIARAFTCLASEKEDLLTKVSVVLSILLTATAPSTPTEAPFPFPPWAIIPAAPAKDRWWAEFIAEALNNASSFSSKSRLEFSIATLVVFSIVLAAALPFNCNLRVSWFCWFCWICCCALSSFSSCCSWSGTFCCWLFTPNILPKSLYFK